MAALKRPLNQECIDLFRSGVERVLKNWTALKLAVDHGTGGPNSKELAANLVQYIGDIFCEEGNLEPEDVSDVLVEVMDTQFDTWCEDNSPDEIASLLCKLYSFCLQENVNELRTELDNLPASSSNQSKELQPALHQTDQNAEMRSSLAPVHEAPTADEEMDCVTKSQPEESEWTTVTRRRRVP